MTLLRFLIPLARYLAPHRKLALILLIGLAIEVIFETGLRYSFRYLVDEAIRPQRSGVLVTVLVLLGAGALVYSAACFLCDYLWARFSVLVMNDLKEELYDRLQHHPMEVFARRSVGDLVNHFSADPAVVQKGLVLALPATLLAMGGIGCAAFFLFEIDWRLALLSASGLAISLFSPRMLTTSAFGAAAQLRAAEGEVASTVQEALLAQPVVKAFGIETLMLGRFRGRLEHLSRKAVRANFLEYLVQRLPMLTFLLQQLIVLTVGASLALNGHISVGDLASYQLLLIGLTAGVSNLTWAIPQMIESAAALERLLDLMRIVPTVAEPAQPKSLPRLTLGLSFRDVTFGYTPDLVSLDNVSLDIPQGSFTVVIGPSGSGKSTLVNLLLRFYDPRAGKVMFDGVNIRDVTQRELRSRFGIVFQDAMLINDTVAENIRLGMPSADDDHVEMAARLAGIHERILRLPKGYATVIGERGGQLSGGERQRIALARALVRDPEVLILDEATSALDPATEEDVVRILRHLSRGLTILAITHRPALAAYADQLLVLSHGKLIQCPTETEVAGRRSWADLTDVLRVRRIPESAGVNDLLGGN